MCGSRPCRYSRTQRTRARAETLLEALKDENADVRAQACWALGERRVAAAVDPLILLLKNDREADVRAQAAEALGSIGDQRAADALTAALKDKESDVRRGAANALAQLVDADAEHK